MWPPQRAPVEGLSDIYYETPGFQVDGMNREHKLYQAEVVIGFIYRVTDGIRFGWQGGFGGRRQEGFHSRPIAARWVYEQAWPREGERRRERDVYVIRGRRSGKTYFSREAMLTIASTGVPCVMLGRDKNI